MSPMDMLTTAASIGGFLIFVVGVGRWLGRLTSTVEVHGGIHDDAKTERAANAAKLETLDDHREKHGTRLTKIEGKVGLE